MLSRTTRRAALFWRHARRKNPSKSSARSPRDRLTRAKANETFPDADIQPLPGEYGRWRCTTITSGTLGVAFTWRQPVTATSQTFASGVTSEIDVLTFAGPSLKYPTSAHDFFDPANGLRESYVLWSNSAAVATGALQDRDPGEVRIGRALVDPAQRGRGLGRAMMRLLINRAATRAGVIHLTLGVFERNLPSRELCESVGFIVADSCVLLRVGQDRWTILEMKLELTDSTHRENRQ